jgi:hypothetical protein
MAINDKLWSETLHTGNEVCVSLRVSQVSIKEMTLRAALLRVWPPEWGNREQQSA